MYVGDWSFAKSKLESDCEIEELWRLTVVSDGFIFFFVIS